MAYSHPQSSTNNSAASTVAQCSDNSSSEGENTGAPEDDNHFSAYSASVLQGSHLRDQVIGLEVNCFVAVQPATKIPWLGRVVELDVSSECALVRWFHSSSTANIYHFVPRELPEWVDYGAIVCNGLTMTPETTDPCEWRLQTPMTVIREMNQRNILGERAYPDFKMSSRLKDSDITGIQFNTAKEFTKYLHSNSKRQKL